ncbi:MAG: FtsX-like permease family protein [Acidobacteriota bacterium]
MKVYFSLFKRFIIRALAREKLRSSFTALGISLGVGVMIAIRLANMSALDSFKTATQSIAGETSIQISGTAGRFDETQLNELDWLRQYGDISPVIEGYALASTRIQDSETGSHESGVRSLESQTGSQKSEVRSQNSNNPLITAEASSIPTTETQSSTSGIATPDARLRTPDFSEFVHILGVDILRDRSLRRYQLLDIGANETEITTRDFLFLLTDAQSIIITEKFARKHHLKIADKLRLTIGDTQREFVIRGMLRDEGPAKTLDGNFILMDIAAAQLAFNRLGYLDRVDVKLKNKITIEQAESAIAGRLPQGLQVTRPSATYNQIEKMIAAFHFNLNALGSIALFVGLFLIYNTIAISVLARREEIGTLRAIGASRRAILALFLGEAILLAIVGTIIGLGIGRLMANFAVRATATTVDTFYIASAATESAAHNSLTWMDALLAFVIALALALVAALMPAMEASRVRVVEALRGAKRLAASFNPSPKTLIIAAILFIAGFVFSRLDAVNGLPLFGYLAAVSLMFGGAFLVPQTLLAACKFLGRGIGKLFRRFAVEAKLASANLRGAIPRVSISVAALSVSLAMMVAISIMIGSFRETVTYWVDQSLVADIFARPIIRSSTTVDSEINDQALAMIKADAAVDAVHAYASQSLTYQGNLISLGSSDFSIFARHGRLLFKSPANGRERMIDAVGKDEIIVTESFALKFKKAVGDTVELATNQGTQQFKIIGIYFDYSSNRGTIAMDKQTHDKYFTPVRPVSLSIYLKPGEDTEAARDRLAQTVGLRFQLIITTNATIRNEVMRIFNSTFAITYALELIAIVVAGLGVISTLITLILERRAELAMLTFLGSSRSQIRRMIVIEALLIGVVSEAIGAIIGTLMSLVLIYVINVQSFGWTIQFSFPLLFLLQSAVAILLVTAIAGLYPAARASRVEVLNYE